MSPGLGKLACPCRSAAETPTSAAQRCCINTLFETEKATTRHGEDAGLAALSEAGTNRMTERIFTTNEGEKEPCSDRIEGVVLSGRS